MYLSCVWISTISEWTELSLEPRHQECHWVRPKWFISRWYIWRKLCTYLAATLTLSPNEKKRDSTWPTSLGVPSGASKAISKRMVCSTQTVHWSYIKISTISIRTKLSLEPRHLGVPSSASKMISEPMVHLAQIVYLPCTDTNTISKWKEARLHMVHITQEYHRVRPNRFPSLWYIGHKRAPILRQD
jgi:hypothetical protein